MEKLLHERLREHNKATIRYFTCGDEWQIELDMNEAQALADEIECYYIPRPRFDDGEPVQWSEQGLCWQDKDDYDPQVPWYFTAIDRNGIPIATTGDEIVSRAEMTDDGFVKRPTPKVYDADVVPYRRGETIYGIETGDAFEVLNPNLREGYMEARELQGKREICEIKPKFYTHERPVFDANGERICKGDTVWLENQPSAYTVTGFNGKWVVAHGIDGREHQFPHPDLLTHSEPDSLESIAQYAHDEAVKYAGCIEPLNKVADRLTALIERGA